MNSGSVSEFWVKETKCTRKALLFHHLIPQGNKLKYLFYDLPKEGILFVSAEGKHDLYVMETRSPSLEKK